MTGQEKPCEELFQEEAFGPQNKLPLKPLGPLSSNPQDWFWMNGAGYVRLDQVDHKVGFQEMDQAALHRPIQRIVRRSEKN